MKKKSLLWLIVLVVLLLAAGFISVSRLPIGLYDISVADNILVGGDLASRVYAVYQPDEEDPTEERDARLDKAVEVYKRRLELAGYRYVDVVRTDNEGVRLSMSGVGDQAGLSLIMFATDPGLLSIEDADGNRLAELTDIKSAKIAPTGQATGTLSTTETYGVIVELQGESATKLKEVSAANLGDELVFMLDDVEIDRITFNEEADTGKLTLENSYPSGVAYEYALKFSSGYAPIAMNQSEFNTTGPALGDQALSRSITAVVIGFAALVLFLLLHYRLSGLAGALSLVVHALAVLFCFATIGGFALTMAGIVGSLAALAFALCVYVLVLRALSQELKAGKPVGVSIDAAFSKMYKPIIDLSVMALLTGGALFFIGTDAVRDFGAALGIGVAATLLLSTLLLKPLLRLTSGLSEKPALFIKH